ncbi:MAG: exopolysaccharide biosynthesis protein [Candidatus Sumerlaeia bacterium]|nr:exopolysaccharide biosynthesis protein [Candidatus Sumerlaeia bacterium]
MSPPKVPEAVTDIDHEHRNVMTDLRSALSMGRNQYARGEELKLGDLLASLGNSGAPVAAMVLALPFVWPLSLGPITIPASLLILLISINLLRGRDQFPLPARYLAVSLPPSLFRLMRRVIALLCRWFRWHTIPVYPAATTGSRDRFRTACALGILAGALLLAVPTPLIPLTNTFPALTIVSFCVAYLRRGRSEFLWGLGFAVAALIVYAICGAVIYMIGLEGLQALVGRRSVA